MSDVVVARIAAALAEHREGREKVASYTDGRLTLMLYTCRCGWQERGNWADGSTHPAHVASVVAALPDIAIVPLSAPDSHGRWRSERWGVRDDGWLKWSVGTDADGILFASARRGEGKPMNMAAEFELFAAALLAAARAARAAGGQG